MQKEKKLLLARFVNEGPVYYSCTTYYVPETNVVVCEMYFNSNHVYNIELYNKLVKIESLLGYDNTILKGEAGGMTCARPSGIFEDDERLVCVVFTAGVVTKKFTCSKEFNSIFQAVFLGYMNVTRAVKMFFDLKTCQEIE